jgi:hypothetical protein
MIVAATTERDETQQLGTTAAAGPDRVPRRPRLPAAAPAALGVLLGFVWASGLRGWMMQLAGPDSTVTWTGTFAAVLLPGAVVGGLLGWAEHLRRTGSRRPWRWLALAPLLFPVAALSLPGAISRLLATGTGGAALGITLFGMLGGASMSGRGPRWLRLVGGAAAFWLVPAVFLGPPMRPELDPATPLGAWSAATFSALFVALALACAIPLRRAAGTR